MEYNDFWCAMSCVAFFLIVSATPVLNPIDGFYARMAVYSCEKELPRNQYCRIVAEPIPQETTK